MHDVANANFVTVCDMICKTVKGLIFVTKFAFSWQFIQPDKTEVCS